MKNIFFLIVLALFSGSLLYGQSCSLKLIVKDAEDGSVLAEAAVYEDGNYLKSTAANGEAVLTGRTCARFKFKIAKDGYQAVTYFAEAKEAPQDNVVRLINLKRLQANIFQKLNTETIDVKEVKTWSKQLIKGYETNNSVNEKVSYIEKLETTINKLKAEGKLTSKQAKEIL